MSKKRLKLLMLIAWMVVIFMFSQQPGEVSSENNKLVIYIFNLLGLDLNSTFGGFTNLLIRKGAHFTEYFILFILFLNVIKDEKGFYKALAYSIIGVFLYACTDEFHQLFIPGRAGRFGDVLIDTAGGLTALTSIYIYDCFEISFLKRNQSR